MDLKRKFIEKHGVEGIETAMRLVELSSSIPSQVAAGLGVALCNKSSLFAVDPATAVIEVEGFRPFAKVLFYNKDVNNPLLKDFLSMLKAKLQESKSKE